MTAFLQQIALRVLEWVVRPGNIGLKLIGAGVALFGVALGMDVLGQLDYVDGQRHLSFKFATGDSLPAWMTLGAYCIAAGLVVIGLVVVLNSYVNSERLASRRLCVVVELRGLHSSPDTPAKDADLGSLPRQRQGLKVDFRPRTEDELVNPEVWFQFCISSDVDADIISERVSFEWARLGGHRMSVKEIPSFATKATVTLYRVRNDPNHSVMIPELSRMLEEA